MKSEGDFEARIKCVTFPRHRFVLFPGTGRVLKTPSPGDAGSAGMCVQPPTGLSDFSDLVAALEKDKGARDTLFSIPPCNFLSAPNAFRSHGRVEIRKWPGCLGREL